MTEKKLKNQIWKCLICKEENLENEPCLCMKKMLNKKKVIYRLDEYLDKKINTLAIKTYSTKTKMLHRLLDFALLHIENIEIEIDNLMENINKLASKSLVEKEK